MYNSPAFYWFISLISWLNTARFPMILWRTRLGCNRWLDLQPKFEVLTLWHVSKWYYFGSQLNMMLCVHNIPTMQLYYPWICPFAEMLENCPNHDNIVFELQIAKYSPAFLKSPCVWASVFLLKTIFHINRSRVCRDFVVRLRLLCIIFLVAPYMRSWLMV